MKQLYTHMILSEKDAQAFTFSLKAVPLTPTFLISDQRQCVAQIKALLAKSAPTCRPAVGHD